MSRERRGSPYHVAYPMMHVLWRTPPSPKKNNDRQTLVKHYVPATTVACGKYEKFYQNLQGFVYTDLSSTWNLPTCTQTPISVFTALSHSRTGHSRSLNLTTPSHTYFKTTHNYHHWHRIQTAVGYNIKFVNIFQGREPLATYLGDRTFDYIWYTSEYLEVSGILKEADNLITDIITKRKGHCSPLFGSDHLPVVAKLYFKTGKTWYGGFGFMGGLGWEIIF